MRHWTPLWSPIVDSSIWDEPDFVCKVWITMLALKDSDDVCRCNAYQLARRARKTESEVLEALKILSSPDARRIEPQENDGRRIMAVEDGWFILNGAKYREMVQDEMKKARWRRAQAQKRKKERDKKEASVSGQFHGKNIKVNPKIAEQHADDIHEETKETENMAETKDLEGESNPWEDNAFIQPG